jgi:hypothetical protein
LNIIEHFGLSPFLEDSTTVESISTDTPGKITLCLKSNRNIYIYIYISGTNNIVNNRVRARVMVLNGTFNNASAIS